MRLSNLLSADGRVTRLRCVALLALLAACCASVRANEITDRIADGTIVIQGGSYVADGDDVVITYTATTATDTTPRVLNIKAGQATARVLAIGGGGGGGGTLNKSTKFYGAGGGGGAGGMVEASGLAFKGAYAITVGAGGENVAAGTHGEGGDGGDTFIAHADSGTPVSGIDIAVGGGGGGAGGSTRSAAKVTSTYSGVGRPGGSGGGGSQTFRNTPQSYPNDGGKGTDGQGYRGGNATVNSKGYWIGGGGGGAGAPGTDVTIYNQAGGAPGGDGRSSAITGKSVTYAGGGAGGAMDASKVGSVAGGSGGGGSGGTSVNTGARDGTPGTGGGGGGGSNTQPSGAGGSGVLIVRLSGYMAGGVIIPTIEKFVYDGSPKTATVKTIYYTVAGVIGGVTETVAGNYKLRITLTAAGEAVGWDDPTDPRISGNSCDIEWSIAQKPIDEPTTVEASYTYTGSEQTGYTNGVWYTVAGDAKATDAGTYHPTATLKDASNTKWADGAATTRTLNWTIAKRTVKKPEATATVWTYTGNVQTGFVENVALYAFDEQNRQTNAGTFTPTATLADAANTEWEDAEHKADPSRSDFSWTIGPQIVTKPTARTGLVFAGAEQTAVDEETLASTAFALSGHTATDAGDYKFTAKLNNGAGLNYKWKNGNCDDLVVDWSIAKKTVDLPQPEGTTPTYTYDGTEKEPFPTSDWYAIIEGVGKATAADDYVCKIRLNYNSATVTNVTWTGGSAAEMSWDWKISAKKIEPPTATTFAYDESTKGTAVVRTMLTIPADAEYRLDTARSDELEQSQAGTYAYTLELNDPDNTVWTSGETTPQEVVCKIEKAENEIYGLAMKDWQDGSTESDPSVTDVRFGQKSSVKWTYSDSPTGGWQADKLTDNGYHYVRASVEAAANWNAAESVRRYCVWTHPSKVFSDCVDITVDGYAGATELENFPVLVRIREPVCDETGAVTNGLPGFTYDRAGKTGENLRFLYENATPTVTSDDQLLSFDVEKWDVAGESLVWVKVPTVKSSEKTAFRMHWHTDDPKSANDPTLVWSDYAGVWHMGETIVSDAGSVVSKDSTANGLDGTPDPGSAGNTARMVSAAGVVGCSRVIESSAPGKWGNHLVVPNYDGLALGGQFVFSTWAKFDNYSNWPILVSRKASNTSGEGWAVEHSNNDRKILCVRGSAGKSVNASVFPKAPKDIPEYTQLVFAYDGTALTVYANGVQKATGEIAAVTDNGRELCLGGGYSATGTQEFSVYGKLDETRLRKGTLSADWVKAEYQTVTDAGFLSFGLVSVEGTSVNYWTKMPSIAKTQWEPGTITDEDIGRGTLRFGSVTNWFVTMPSEAVTNSTLQTASGTYRVFFDMARPETGSYTVYGGLVSLEYAIVGHTWFDQIGDTTDGRILLGNNDSMEDHEVTGQAYYETDSTLQTYWKHEGSSGGIFYLPNVEKPTSHELVVRMPEGLKTLWRLTDVHMGNLFRNDAMDSTLNGLPWSGTSGPRNSGVAVSANESTALIMRNMKDAVINSPCYTNGIGTVYFDAVNGFVSDVSAKIVVEIATQTWDGKAPTDENCAKGDDPYYYLTHNDHDELSEENDMWVPVRPQVLVKRKGSEAFAVDTTQTYPDKTIVLSAKSGGGTEEFYRVIVTTNYGGAARFRIRRTAQSGGDTDIADLILLDNIIVSPPAMSANLGAVGEYDKDLVGKQVLGQACAFDKPFPGRTDTGLHGRAKISYVTTPGIAYDTSKFVASARLNYRWRYLNQSFEPVKLNGVDQWKTVYLDHTALKDGVMSAVRPLEFPSAAGDIEWFYDMTLQAPTYKFVDYSGLTFEKPTGDFTEELRSVTNHVAVAAGDRLASGGSEWFLRLREGKSDWQKMQVVIESEETTAGKLVGTFDMELVDDNMWRAFVVVPTNSEGTCTFCFRGLNLQTGSPTGLVENAKSYGLSASGQEANIPASGTLTEGGYPVQFTIDHAAGYLEFKMSDRYLTFQVGRAEYQDFNLWNDAHSVGDEFKVDSTDTNSVNIADMKILSAPTGEWPLFKATDHTGWDEAFEVADYAATDGRFVKNVFHQERHETPNSAAWAAQNITFVSEKFVARTGTPDPQKLYSGMAGKLLGNGSGLMDFSSASAPDGIERIDLSARIGQSDTFDAFACCASAYSADNYTFFVPVTMSHNTKADGSESGDMAVGASVSLVGYHTDKVGCYEVRCERLFSGAQIRLSLWKWTYADQKYASQRLAYRDFEYSGDHYKPICWSQEKTAAVTTPEKDRTFYGMFISLETEYADGDAGDRPLSTRIICGLSSGNTTSVTDPWKYYSYSATDTANRRDKIEWYGLTYTDESDPHGWGRYGVVSKDCPAQFVMPAHQNKPFDGTIEKENANNDDKGQGGKWFAVEHLAFDKVPDVFEFVDDREELHRKRIWTTNPGRCECFTNTATGFYRWIGLHAPTNVTQTLELYLKKRNTDESNWTLASTPIAVSEYGFVQRSFDLKVTGQWDVRLRTGASKAIDVVVDNITQYKWQADDLPSERTVESAFYYSQCVVETNESAKTNFVRLQPARAEATRPVSIRSPSMDGLGKLTFTYDLDELDRNAEIWVQVATNKVHGNMTGEGGYNESVKSVDLGAQPDVGTWITVKKFKATGAEDDDRDLTKSEQKSVYLGWHNHPDRPLKGLWRLFVPTNVVKAANVAATNVTKNVDHGAIKVTGVVCTDEPGFSDRSWRGWNMRTVGDSTDSEKRMNLVDMKTESGVGNVCALNNSIGDVYYKGKLVEAGQEIYERLCQSYPAIYSPLMHPVNRRSGVGSVSFKARLYSTTGAPATAGGGQVWIYGSKDPTKTGEDDWTFLAMYPVESSVFSNYTWSAGNELYTAIKIEIHDPSAKTKIPGFDRIVLDEVVLGEKVPPTINFEYARPFRNNLFTEDPIADILSPAEQPLAGESWGVQTKLSLQQLTDEIDLEKGFEVYFMHRRGKSPWGYGNWEGTISSNRLVQVGDASNLVFRSVGDRPESLVEPATAGGEVVQFMLAVKYYDRGGKSDWITMDSSWQQPDWFYPLDYNETYGGYDEEGNFAAYTVLDTVSPGRAWINEVSWNDGTTAQNGGNEVVTNQYVELCIPSGVDMTNWKLRVTDRNENAGIFAVLGDSTGIPKNKVSAYAVNGYEFFVLQSPKTKKAGGIRYPGESKAAADGTWYETSLGESDVTGGTLKYGSPYQFELIRPSGIIEHQFVLDGTNTLAKYPGWRGPYDGTNLVAKLNESERLESGSVSPLRFYAGSDVARKADGRSFASVGVTGGSNGVARVADWPGGSNTWTEAMGFTPGRLNEGQKIPKDWFIAPNGTNSWVYFLLETDHIAQRVGSETGSSVLAVLPQGRTTNVVYSVANWYEAAVAVNGTNVLSGRTGTVPFTLTPTGTTYVTASALPQRQLSEQYGLDDGNAYTPAVLQWLRTKYPDASAEDIRLARFKGLQNWDDVSWLTLTDMYWLDIPPVPVTDGEKATNNGTNWWFRGGISKMGVDHKIQRTRGGREVTYTNKQVDVTMYVSNACTHVKWAPEKLQGLGNETSDTYGGSWTSVTFKVKGGLALATATNFLPFRVFTFAPGSFSGAEGDATVDPALPPFSSRIDILDPFQSPIGENYGWNLYPNTKAYFIWAIDTKVYPYSTEKLKSDSTYPETIP